MRLRALLARAATTVVASAFCGAAAAADPSVAWSAPAVRVFGGSTQDTDDVVLRLRGLEIEALAFGAVRLGVLAEHVQMDDPASSGTAQGLALRAHWQPAPAIQLEGLAGGVRLAPGAGAATDRLQAALRLRWRSPDSKAATELRLTRRPLLASPALLLGPVDLTELRAAFTAPLAGPFLARARLQHGVLEDSRQNNQRTGYELAGLLQPTPSTEVGLTYLELGYRRKAQSAYSAPRRLHGVELATFGEWGTGPLSLTLDAGIGRQQVARHDEAAPRGWTKSLRLLASLSWRVASETDLALSYERYDSPVGGNGSIAGSMWSSKSMALSLRTALGR